MKKQTLFQQLCNIPIGGTVEKRAVTFEELFYLKYPAACKENSKLIFFMSYFKIYATTKKDYTMKVWNGKHPSEDKNNHSEHVCKKGTKVLIWMVSRFEDVGITDNLVNPVGYDLRGVDCADLKNFVFEKVRSTRDLLKPTVNG